MVTTVVVAGRVASLPVAITDPSPSPFLIYMYAGRDHGQLCPHFFELLLHHRQGEEGAG